MVQTGVPAHRGGTRRGALVRERAGHPEVAVEGGRLPVLLVHRVPRPDRAARGHAGVRGDRAADRGPRLCARPAQGRDGRGHARPAGGRPGQGGRGPDLDPGSCPRRGLNPAFRLPIVRMNPICEVNVDTVQMLDRGLELDEHDEARASLDTMLLALVDAQGSDLHLTVGAPPRIRVFGKLVALPEYDRLEPADTETLIRAACTGEQWARFEADHELDFAYSIKGISRFR